MTIMMMRNIGMVGYVVALVNIVALVVCLSSITPSPQQEAQFPAATTTTQATTPASAFTTVDAFTSSWTTTTTSRGRVGRNTVTSSNAMIAQTFLHAVSGPEPAAEEDAARTMVSRRAALQQGGVTAAATAVVALASVATVAIPSPASADIYDEQEKERKLKAQQKAEDGKKLLPKVLFGGTALSVPFFLPNLIRLGKKLFS